MEGASEQRKEHTWDSVLALCVSEFFHGYRREDLLWVSITERPTDMNLGPTVSDLYQVSLIFAVYP